jgi:hypothetical protein
MSISKVISLVLLEKAITQTLGKKDGKKKSDRYNAIRQINSGVSLLSKNILS